MRRKVIIWHYCPLTTNLKSFTWAHSKMAFFHILVASRTIIAAIFRCRVCTCARAHLLSTSACFITCTERCPRAPCSMYNARLRVADTCFTACSHATFSAMLWLGTVTVSFPGLNASSTCCRTGWILSPVSVFTVHWKGGDVPLRNNVYVTYV